MRLKNSILILVALVSFTTVLHAQKPKTLKPISWRVIDIPEPSDICMHPNQKSFFIVSDDGYLFETDLKGDVIRKSTYRGLDSEAVHADENYVYVVEEFTRKIIVLDIKNLETVRTVHHPYAGGRNKSYEAFTFNKAKEVFVLLTEKEPIYLFELDKNLNKINEINMNHIARDISAATYFENHLWLLSDEDRTVFKLNPTTYEVINKWIVPVVNPEGITFQENGTMIIISDDMERMYFFNHPERQ
jgi:uncharacterized protein YjiK